MNQTNISSTGTTKKIGECTTAQQGYGILRVLTYHTKRVDSSDYYERDGWIDFNSDPRQKIEH